MIVRLCFGQACLCAFVYVFVKYHETEPCSNF